MSEKENENIVENEFNVDENNLDVKIDHKKRAEAKKLTDLTFKYIKEGKIEEANNLIDEAYVLDENFADIFLAKLYIKYDVKTYNELRSKANEKIINSPFFKAAYDLGDQKLKDKLNYIVEEVEYKKIELNLEGADIEQLLKHLRLQKQKNVDYAYTISLILTTLYKSFRYITKQFIDENIAKDNLIAIIKKGEANFQYYVDILYHFDDISDIKDIIGQIIKEHRSVNAYLLLVLKKVIENNINNKDKLIEIKSFLEFTYVNHEADELLQLIEPHLKQPKEFNKRALIVGSMCSVLVLAFVGIGIAAATNTRDAPVILNGVTYTKNNSNGYTIASYDFESSSLTFEDSIDGLPVNEINPDLFVASDIKYIYNFPDNIREIPEGCFESCDSLEVIEISSDSILSTIGSEAFKDCVSLKTLNIPQYVSYIGADAFLNTPNLVNLTKESTYEFDEEFLGLTKRVLSVDLQEGELLDANNNPITLDKYYYSWDNLKIPLPYKQNYDFIGFQINDNPNNTIAVEEGSSIITVPLQGYTSIDLKAQYLTAETYIDESYGYRTTYIALDDRSHYRLESIEKLEGTSSTSLILMHYIGGVPVDEMNPNALSGSAKATVSSIINFSTYMKEIPEGAFDGCLSLSNFVFSDTRPSHIERIGANAFRNCKSLRSISLPSSIKEIGDNAFLGTDNLIEFSSSYDFNNYDLSNHEEAERIGFTPRKYTYQIEDDTSTSVSGIYYIPEEIVEINFVPRDGYRAVAIDEKTNASQAAIDDESSSIYYKVSGHSSLNLKVYYERYLVEDEYDVELVLPSGDSGLGKLPVSYQLNVDISGNSHGEKILPSEVFVKYYIDETSLTSNINCQIQDNILTVSFKENVNEEATGIVGIYCEVLGKYSNEVMLRSDTETIRFSIGEK